MELLSVEYGNFPNSPNGQSAASKNACLKVRLAIDPELLVRYECDHRSLVAELSQFFPSVRESVDLDSCSLERLDQVAHMVACMILDLQRDLCEWPSGSQCFCAPVDSSNQYELFVESIDRQVGTFSAQLAVDLVRMVLIGESFNSRLMWVVDLVRHLRRQPRLHLSPRRVASLLSCSPGSAEWAIQELERYGYLNADQPRRPRRSHQQPILVVDDSAQMRDLLSRILESLGYDVVTAVDGEEGLILLSWADYKAIFVDLMMPVLGGAEFIRQARAAGVDNPIFVVSAYDYHYGAQQIKELGATAFIPKPFSINQIEKLVKTYLR